MHKNWSKGTFVKKATGRLKKNTVIQSLAISKLHTFCLWGFSWIDSQLNGILPVKSGLLFFFFNMDNCIHKQCLEMVRFGISLGYHYAWVKLPTCSWKAEGILNILQSVGQSHSIKYLFNPNNYKTPIYNLEKLMEILCFRVYPLLALWLE